MCVPLSAPLSVSLPVILPVCPSAFYLSVPLPVTFYPFCPSNSICSLIPL
jgi:hypothetical protein